MKFAVACLLGATSAIALNDAPPYFNEPTWKETFPSAAGLVQTSACQKSGQSGVLCDNMLFATGMNGDEDLGQNIIMKGDKFHYNQENVQVEESWVPVVVKSTGPLPVCTGTNGLDGTNCARAVCNGTNGPLDGPSGTPCTREEPAAIPHYNTEPTAGQPYQTSGNITPQHPSALDPPAPISAALLQAEPEAGANQKATAAVRAGFNNKGYPQPEKVLVLDPKIARTHTTFYSQQ